MSKGILSTANIKGKSYFNSFANDEFPVVEQVSDTKQIGHGDGYVSDGIVPATSEIDELKLMGNTVKNLVPSEPTPTEEFTQYEESAFVQTSSDTNIKMGNGELKQALVEGNTYKNLANRLSNRTNEVTITSSGNLNTLLQEELDQYTEILEDEPFKNSIVEGKTLVNLIPNRTPGIQQFRNDDDCYIEGDYLVHEPAKIDDTTSNNRYIQTYNSSVMPIKANTIYTMFVFIEENTLEILDNTSSDRIAYFSVYPNSNNGEKCSIGIYLNTLKTGVYKQKFSFSISDTLDQIHYIYLSDNVTGGKLKVRSNVMVLEGDYTNIDIDIPYFEGMKSVEYTGTAENPSTVLKTVGKNLFDKAKAENGYLLDNDPYNVYKDNLIYDVMCSNYIRVKPNTTYVYSIVMDNSEYSYWMGMYFYNEIGQVSSENPNRKVSNNVSTNTFVTPSDCNYVRISSRGIAQPNSTFQLEEGSIATSYEPYKESLVTTTNTLILGSIDGAKDTLNLNTGVLTKNTYFTDNIASLLENKCIWHNTSNTSASPVIKISTSVPSEYTLVNVGYGAKSVKTAMCDKFKVIGDENGYSTSRGSYITTREGGIFIHLIKADVGLPTDTLVTKNDVIEYFRNNPIKFITKISNSVISNVEISSNKCLVYGQAQSDTVVLPDFRYSLPTNKYEIPELKANTYYTVKTNEESFNLNNYITTGYTQPVITESDSSSFKVKTDVEDTTVAIEDNKPAKEFKLEGQTYQNILPEPTSLVMSTDLENTSINDQLTSGVKMVDCIAPIAKLEGRTLVNILSGEISDNTTNSNFIDYFFNQNLKTNTIYTAIFKVETDASILRAGITQNTATWNSNTAIYTNGYNKILLTTTTDIAYSLRIRYNDEESKQLSSSEVMLIEGDYTNIDIPYFEGMKSVEAPSVKTVGKNLFDGQLEDGDLLIGSGEESTNANLSRSKYIKVDGNKNYVTNDTDNNYRFFFYDANKNYIGDDKKITFLTPQNCKYIRFHISKLYIKENFQLEEGSTATTYEPYKENIISTPEDFVLRGVNDTKDSLDLNTGKVIRRIGEVILAGSDDETWTLINTENTSEYNNTYCWRLTLAKNAIPHAYNDNAVSTICDKLNWGVYADGINEDYEHYRTNGATSGPASYIYIWLNQSKATNTDELKTYLAANPITIQYVLETPTTETVTMTATSNWKEVTLNSTANLATGTNYSNFNIFNNLTNAVYYGIPFKYNDGGLISDNLNYYRFDGEQFSNLPLEGISDGGGYGQLFIRFNNDKLSTNNLDGIKSYLSTNNLKLRYLNNTIETCIDSRLLLFRNGHIISSSNTILPTITYQSKTNNSYIMNLMTPNTQYTMNLYEKANASTFSIDGTSITMGSGNIFTFTSPNTLTNKFLIMNTGWKALPLTMILKGDMTTKEIPYFKGIRSSFEGNSNIEIRTTGKNLLDISKYTFTNKSGLNDAGNYASNNSPNSYCSDFIDIQSSFNVNGKIRLSCTHINGPDSSRIHWAQIFFYNSNKKAVGRIHNHGQINLDTSLQGYIPKNAKYLRIALTTSDLNSIIICEEENFSSRNFEPYKSHTTTLNIANPLRSLPNGVCDTVEFNGDGTVTYTQRVGKIVLNGTEGWNSSTYSYTDIIEFIYYNNTYDGTLTINDRFSNNGDNVERFVGLDNGSFYLRINKNRLDSLDENGIKKYLQNNPITVYCAYKTPNIIPLFISELPHLFKNGHIFTNTDTPAKITYKPYTLRTVKVSSGSPLTTNVFYSKDPNITVIEGSVENYKLPQFDGLLSANLKGVNNCALSQVYTLRSLPDGTCDTFNALTGVITRNITEIVMNGGTTGNRKASGISSSHPDNGITFWVNNLNIDSNRGSTDRYVLSDYGLDSAFISTTTGAVIDRLTISTGTDTNGTLRFAVPNSMGITTAEAFNEWLTEHPITVLCKANDVSYISISDILKPQASKNGTIYLDTTDNSINPVFKYRMPTTNYYQLDMKDNTTYTVQAQGSYTLNRQTTTVSGSTTINSNTNIIDL